MKKLMLALSLVLTVGTADAGLMSFFRSVFGIAPIDYGAWECLACNIPATGTGAQDIQLLDDFNTFIISYNGQIHDSKGEGRKARWVLGSIITICNAANCVRLQWTKLGQEWTPISGSINRMPEGTPLGIKVHVPAPLPDVRPKPGVGLIEGQIWDGTTYVPTLTVSIPSDDLESAPAVSEARVLTPSVTVTNDGPATLGDLVPGASETFIGEPFQQETPHLDNAIGNVIGSGDPDYSSLGIGINSGGGSGSGGWQGGDNGRINAME